MRIAIVGSGIAGLASAYILGRTHDVTLFEAAPRLGGHSNTVMVDDPEVGPLNVDTGFIVHNRRNYPLLVRLFSELGVATQASEMTFGVDDRVTGITYGATNMSTLFAHRQNIAKPTLWRMLSDVNRFYRVGQQMLAKPKMVNPGYTIADFLDEHRFSTEFIDLYLTPLGSAVWSANPNQFGLFPALSLLRFMDNHGLLGWRDRPEWRTVVNGSVSYVNAIASRFGGVINLATPVTSVRRVEDLIEVEINRRSRTFDAVVLACHSDQALDLIESPTVSETEILGALPYQPNEAVLHTDISLLPRNQNAWASWNYRRWATTSDLNTGPAVTYDMTRLQRLDGQKRYLVSLNSSDRINPASVIDTFDYAHPIFTPAALQAQDRVDEINGADRLFFAGAWQGYGFHEDGIASAVRTCKKLGVSW